ALRLATHPPGQTVPITAFPPDILPSRPSQATPIWTPLVCRTTAALDCPALSSGQGGRREHAAATVVGVARRPPAVPRRRGAALPRPGAALRPQGDGRPLRLLPLAAPASRGGRRGPPGARPLPQHRPADR